MSDRDKRRRYAGMALGLLLAAGAVALATLWRGPSLGIYDRPERIESLIGGLGLAGPVAIIALQMVQVVVAPIPGQMVGLVSGYLYGPWLGALYSMVGLLLGTLLAVYIVRRWGRPLVERLVDAATLARVDRFLARLGLPLLFLVFLLPFFPDDTILLVAGLSGIPLAGIVLAALLGRLPGVVISAWLGTGATGLTGVQWVMVAGATLLVAVPIYHWRGSLERLMWSWVSWLRGGRNG